MDRASVVGVQVEGQEDAAAGASPQGLGDLREVALHAGERGQRFLRRFLEVLDDTCCPHLLTPRAREFYQRQGWGLHVSLAHARDDECIPDEWANLSRKWHGAEFTSWPKVIEANAVVYLLVNNSLLLELRALQKLGRYANRRLHISM